MVKPGLTAGTTSPHVANSSLGQIEGRRWLLVATLAIFIFANSLCWFTYTSTITLAKTHFKINDQQALLLTNSYLYAFILFSGLGSYFAYKNAQKTLTICIILSLFGAWFRYIGNDDFSDTLFGQFILGIAASPIYSLVIVITEDWFTNGEKRIAQSACGLAAFLGWSIGYLIPTVMSQGDPDRLYISPLLEGMFVLIPLFLRITWINSPFPDNSINYSPLIGPSRIISFADQYHSLLRIPRFKPTVIFLGIYIGLACSFPVISNLALEPYNITYKEKALLAFIYLFSAAASKILTSLSLGVQTGNKQSSIIEYFSLCTVFTLTMLSFFVNVFEYPDMFLLGICYALLGASLLGFVPHVIDSFINITFPISQLISISVFLASAALFGCLQTHISALQIFKGREYVLLAAMTLPCWIYITFYYKEDLKRVAPRLTAARTSEQIELLCLDELGLDYVYPGEKMLILSPIQNKRSLKYFGYHQLSVFSKDLISSTPSSPLLKDDGRQNRSSSMNIDNRKKFNNDHSELFELMDLSTRA